MIRIFSLLFSMSLFQACNSGNGNNLRGSGTGVMTMNIKNVNAGEVVSTLSRGLPFQLQDYGAASIGSSGLSSFELYIRDIQFCESVDVNGSAYSNPINCFTVYENADDDYDTFDVSDATNAIPGKYFDLLSATDRVSLSTETQVVAGTYNFGIIRWYRPIKFVASIPLANDNFLYTKECPELGACEISNMSESPAERSVVDFGSGGTWIKFLQPLEISGSEDLTVDLAFDLNRRIFGGRDVLNGQVREVQFCNSVQPTSDYCGIYVPVFRLSPTAHSSESSTMVETYEMGGASTQWKLRIDIYYAGDDDEKSVTAADIYTVPTGLTDTNIATAVYVYQIETQTDGTLRFEDKVGNPQLTDFERAEVGGAIFTCPIGSVLAECPANTTVNLTWSTRTVRRL